MKFHSIKAKNSWEFLSTNQINMTAMLTNKKKLFIFLTVFEGLKHTCKLELVNKGN